MVDFHARWHPLFMGARGYVERGELGAPVMAYARLSDTIHVPTEMLSWSGHSGPEWFLFPHTMDIVRWLFEREPVEVYAKGYRGVLDGRHQVLGRHPGDRRVRGRRVLHVRDVVDRPQQLHQRRRQPPLGLWREGRTRGQERAVTLGVHGSVPHAVLVRVGDAVRQGLGLPVRADAVLRGLCRPGHHAREQRPRRAGRHRDDRRHAAVAGRTAPRLDGGGAGDRRGGPCEVASRPGFPNSTRVTPRRVTARTPRRERRGGSASGSARPLPAGTACRPA